MLAQVPIYPKPLELLRHRVDRAPLMNLWDSKLNEDSEKGNNQKSSILHSAPELFSHRREM